MPPQRQHKAEVEQQTRNTGQTVFQDDYLKNLTIDQFNELLDKAKTQAEDPDVDPQARIIEQVLNAHTPDDVLTPVEALKARDVIGHALVCAGFDLNQSEFDVGTPMYASMRCVYVGLLPPQYLEVLRITNSSPPIGLNPGEDVVVNCGHKKVIAQLVQLSRLDAFPQNVVFGERGRSKVSGSSMLTLLKWDSEPGEGQQGEAQQAEGEPAPF